MSNIFIIYMINVSGAVGARRYCFETEDLASLHALKSFPAWLAMRKKKVKVQTVR